VTAEPVSLETKLAAIQDYWNPRVVGELNGQHVRLAKLRGDFIWHHHENEDELFLVLKGTLRLELRTPAGPTVVELNPGELFIVPRGVDHRPVAPEEAHVLLFEPASTLNTGNVRNEQTVEDLEHL
jgi:mannose-6-phosphate isomerase-like protein (cupin superfamily)